jgi:hypothetical protein
MWVTSYDRHLSQDGVGTIGPFTKPSEPLHGCITCDFQFPGFNVFVAICHFQQLLASTANQDLIVLLQLSLAFMISPRGTTILWEPVTANGLVCKSTSRRFFFGIFLHHATGVTLPFGRRKEIEDWRWSENEEERKKTNAERSAL